MTATLLETTKSLCPVCLRVLPAEIWERGDEVFLERLCPEHGPFSVVIWRGEPSFKAWKRPKKPLKVIPQTPKNEGCPWDCGLCPDHGQNPCTVLLELTTGCDLNCPICFADSKGQGLFRPLEELLRALTWIKGVAGEVVIQLSGGEPTLHPGLLKLVALAAKLFPAVQLNTNGLKLAKDPKFAQDLGDAGLSWVFLQFDGVTDQVYEVLRGKPLLNLKRRAVTNCAAVGLPVVLVPTVVKGVNDQELGAIVDYARMTPIIRGVHAQPLTQTGRVHLSDPQSRITLPEVIQAFCRGGDGAIKPEGAFPPGCEHERCSFHLRFRRDESGKLTAKVPQTNDCGCGPMGCPPKTSKVPSPPAETDLNRTRAVDIIIQSWGGDKGGKSGPSDSKTIEPPLDVLSPDKTPSQPLKALTIPMAKAPAQSLDAFLERAKRETFSLTGMAFQDRHNLDLARLKGCCVHIYQEPAKLIPFCAMNLTAANGDSFYRKGPKR